MELNAVNMNQNGTEYSKKETKWKRIHLSRSSSLKFVKVYNGMSVISNTY